MCLINLYYLGLTTMVSLKFLHPAALQPNNSISEDQKHCQNWWKQNKWPSITVTVNEPLGEQIMYFTFTHEFFAYHCSPSRLVLIKPQTTESNSLWEEADTRHAIDVTGTWALYAYIASILNTKFITQKFFN